MRGQLLSFVAESQLTLQKSPVRTRSVLQMTTMEIPAQPFDQQIYMRVFRFFIIRKKKRLGVVGELTQLTSVMHQVRSSSVPCHDCIPCGNRASCIVIVVLLVLPLHTCNKSDDKIGLFCEEDSYMNSISISSSQTLTSFQTSERFSSYHSLLREYLSNSF